MESPGRGIGRRPVLGIFLGFHYPWLFLRLTRPESAIEPWPSSIQYEPLDPGVASDGHIQIAAVQFEARDADRDYNFSRIESLAQRAAAKGAEIVSFHECCICGYTFLQELSRESSRSLPNRSPARAPGGWSAWPPI